MQTYDRNVCLAAFLLVLGGILVIVGVTLYLKGDPEDSGEHSPTSADIDTASSHLPKCLAGDCCRDEA